MAEDRKEDFLRRWSRRKHEEKQVPAPKDETPAPTLPAVDKLTPESDFTGFMHPKVEDALRRAALKKLFADPHFNIPDPFEPYSRDWNNLEPISEEVLKTLNQARTLLFSEEEKAQAQAADEAKAEQEAHAEEETRLADKEAKDDEPGRQDT